MCFECFNKVKSNETPTCYLCRAPVDLKKSTRDLRCEGLLEQMLPDGILCPEKCGKVLNFSELGKHLQICGKHLCPEGTCNLYFAKDEMMKHLQDDHNIGIGFNNRPDYFKLDHTTIATSNMHQEILDSSALLPDIALLPSAPIYTGPIWPPPNANSAQLGIDEGRRHGRMFTMKPPCPGYPELLLRSFFCWSQTDHVDDLEQKVIALRIQPRWIYYDNFEHLPSMSLQCIFIQKNRTQHFRESHIVELAKTPGDQQPIQCNFYLFNDESQFERSIEFRILD